MAFQGYYIRIGNCYFQSPAIKREGYTCNYRIVQVSDNTVLASGKLSIKKLEHQPTKLTIDFPAMTREQWRNYCYYFRGKGTGEDEYYLTVEYYIPETDTYGSGTFYHTDLDATEIGYMRGGIKYIQPPTISLIEY